MTKEELIVDTISNCTPRKHSGLFELYNVYNFYYEFMITNARNYMNSNPENDYNAFDISTILSICLAKRKEDILNDLIR